jgi:hypothetical protein
MRGTARFKDGSKMYSVLWHKPKGRIKEMWLLFIWRNDTEHKWYPYFWHHKDFSWGFNWWRFHFAKSTHTLGVL